jgi:hypothetical protein
MIAMNAQPGDEKGHFIASMFSGSPMWYNLMPLHKGSNHNVGNKMVQTYADMEREIAKFLKDNGSTSRVKLDMIAVPVNQPRPDGFELRVSKFVGNRRVQEQEGYIPNCKGLRC